MMKQMGGLSAEQIMGMPGRVLKYGGGAHNFLNGVSSAPSTLTNTDAEEIAKLRSVHSVTPMLETVARIQYSKDDKKPTTVEGMLVGTSESYQKVLHTSLEEGRFFTNEEGTNKNKLAVLGSGIHASLLNQTQELPETGPETNVAPEKKWWQKLLDKLTGSSVSAAEAPAEKETLVGKEVNIQGETFTVVGVLESEATLGMTSDNSILMPVQTALEVTSTENLTSIYVKAGRHHRYSPPDQRSRHHERNGHVRQRKNTGNRHPEGTRCIHHRRSCSSSSLKQSCFAWWEESSGCCWDMDSTLGGTEPSRSSRSFCRCGLSN